MIKLLTKENIAEILMLTQQLNPDMKKSILEERHLTMFGFDNYRCFGFFTENKLVGVASGWITVRLYSGKQIELDNVIIDANMQSSGLGKIFMLEIESWAKSENCNTIELNTYVSNGRSHKFYNNLDFNIFGFHFVKKINNTAVLSKGIK